VGVRRVVARDFEAGGTVACGDAPHQPFRDEPVERPIDRDPVGRFGSRSSRCREKLVWRQRLLGFA
jgi:hypothetical protein